MKRDILKKLCALITVCAAAFSFCACSAKAPQEGGNLGGDNVTDGGNNNDNDGGNKNDDGSDITAGDDGQLNQITVTLNTYIDSLMDNTPSYVPAWGKEGFKNRWNYIDGLFMNLTVALYKSSNGQSAEKYKDFFLNYINYYVDKDGYFVQPACEAALPDYPDYDRTTNPGYIATELDSVCESRVLFDAYEMTGDERYLTAIEYTYSCLTDPQNVPIAQGSNGNFSHKKIYTNQIWLDGFTMYVPFLCRYAQLKGQNGIFHDIRMQYEYVRANMFDEEKRLYYHGNDTTKSIFWADPITGNSPSFWLRSEGWFIYSLVESIGYFPEGEDKQYLIGLFKEAIEGVLPYRDTETGMFMQLIDKGNSVFHVDASYFKGLKNKSYRNADGDYFSANVANYAEAAGSSIIAYALMKGGELGYIGSEYTAFGREVFEDIYNHSFKNGKLGDICITAGLGPENRKCRDGSPQYYLAEPVGSDDAKGVAPFLMAFIEYSTK